MDDDLISRKEAVKILMQRAEELQGYIGNLGGACSGAAKLIQTLKTVKRDSNKALDEIVEYMNDYTVKDRDVSDDVICDILEKYGIGTIRTKKN